MRILKNKKGGEKYLSIWWFFVLVVVAGAFIIAVFGFYSADVDVKGIEAEILVNRVMSCLNEKGYFQENNLKNIFESCYLSEKIINESGKYYLEIWVYDSDKKVKESLTFGVGDIKTQCGVKEKSRATHYAECSNSSLFVVNEKGNKLILYVFAGSNQVGKREVGF